MTARTLGVSNENSSQKHAEGTEIDQYRAELDAFNEASDAHLAKNPIRLLRGRYPKPTRTGKMKPMSQQDFAKQIRVVALTVQNWEHGSVNPTWQGFHRIAERFLAPDPKTPDTTGMSEEEAQQALTKHAAAVEANRHIQDEKTQKLLDDWHEWFDQRPTPPAFVLPTPPFFDVGEEVED